MKAREGFHQSAVTARVRAGYKKFKDWSGVAVFIILSRKMSTRQNLKRINHLLLVCLCLESKNLFPVSIILFQALISLICASVSRF